MAKVIFDRGNAANNAPSPGLVLFIVLIIAVFILVGSSFTVIGPGEKGVIVSRFSGVNLDRTMSEGMNFKIPFVEWVEKMSIQKRKYVANAVASSKDLQDVSTSIALNYSLVPEKLPQLRQEIGLDFEAIVIQPITQEIVKQVTAQYTAAELITQRPKVKEEIAKKYRMELQKSHLIFHELSITNFEFSASYSRAIEEKQVAEQRALAEQQKKKLAITLAEGKRAARQEAAEAELFEKTKQAEAILVTAEKEAEAQRILSESVTDKVLMLRFLEKWDGKLPKVTAGESIIPFLNLDVEKEED